MLSNSLLINATENDYDELVNYIAKQQQKQWCHILDKTVSGIKVDLENNSMAAKDFYYLKSNGEIVALAGTEKRELETKDIYTIYGPWASSDDDLKSLMGEVMEMLKDKEIDTFLDQTNPVAAKLQSDYGFRVGHSEFLMSLYKNAVVLKDIVNDSLECKIIDQSDTEVIEEVGKVHAKCGFERAGKFSVEDSDVLFACFKEGKVVGYSLLEIQDTSVNVYLIGTDPEYKRQGVATFVMEKVKEWFLTSEEHLEKLHLNVKEEKTGAKELYEKVGFTTDGTAVAFVR